MPLSLPRARATGTRPRGDARVAPAVVAVLIALAALAMRWGEFGDPIAGLDEQFYLLVGDRMWSGQMPYTDIWDRKPAGLFWLYALIRLLPGNGVVAYQVVATACLAATGIVVARIGRGVLPASANFAAGIGVVLYGILLGSGFGQAPIFYDLLVALAGWAVIDVVERPRADARIDPRACAAMLACGVALTIKTSAVFESAAFGLVLVAADHRRLGVAGAGRAAALYVAIGLAPFALTALPYALGGGMEAFAFANFRSAFLRHGGAGMDSVRRAGSVLMLLALLIGPALAGVRRASRGRRGVLIAWAVAGFVSFVSLGHCYEHYALPMVPPLALLAAYGLASRLTLIPVSTLFAVVIGWYVHDTPPVARQDRADLEALVAALPTTVRTGCLLVFEGPTILYHLSHACLPGRYVFPGHYVEPVEEGALEKPMTAILADTLSRHPAVIVTLADLGRTRAVGNRELMRRTLARAYRPTARRNVRLYGGEHVDTMVWVRR